METVTKDDVFIRLKKVLDPELHASIVDMGLIYDVTISPVQVEDGERTQIHVLMTLTTPGCPLAGMFDAMVKDALADLPGISPERDVIVELTFDPPWTIDMMQDELRARLGL